MFKFIREHKRGVIGTTLFHLLILIFFIIYKGFSTPLPLPDAEGILVNFGTEETGFGDIEPQKAEIKPTEQEVTKPPEQTETIEEYVEEIIEEDTETPEEEQLTQDIEDAPEVKEAEKRKKEEKEKEKKRITEKRRQDSIIEVMRIEQELKAEQIKNDMANRFGGNQSNSQGDTQGTGNQGKTNGDPYAGNYDGSGKGEGYSWNLEGRNVQYLVKPKYNKNDKGTIIVEVIVDRDGNVIDARAGIKGSTITDYTLTEAAKKAALKTKFDTKTDAAPRQTGSITYIFEFE